MITLEINRKNYSDIKPVSAKSRALDAGEIRMQINDFSLTANNVTYAAVGDMIGYWKFFPASNEGYGIVPVWGFADVVESTVDEIAVGSRYYGYYPMGSEMIAKPGKISPAAFTDVTEHRLELPIIYNQYIAAAADPLYEAQQEAEIMLFRPLFTTSFLIDDFLADSDFYGAESCIITSASAKTSFAFAQVMCDRDQRPRIIGLTSAGNKAFCDNLGVYDEVLTYDEVASLDAAKPSIYVDMAGNQELRIKLHSHLGDSLKYACAVGASHWDQMTAGGGAQLAGPRPEMFFAPAQAEKRLKELGRDGFGIKVAKAWAGFLPLGSKSVEMQRLEGADATADAFKSLVDGSADPAIGIIASLKG